MQSRLAVPLLLALQAAAVSPSSSGSIILPQQTAMDSLVTTVVTILLKAFQDPFEPTLVRQQATTAAGSRLLADLLEEVFRRLNGVIVVQLAHPKHGAYRRPSNRDVFFVDEYEAFQLLYRKFTAQEYGTSGRVLVVHSGLLNESAAQRVCDDLWKLRIVNAVLVGNTDGGVRMWSYVPYLEESCGLVNLVELKMSEQGVDSLYPDKTKTFHGCRFRVGSFETRPFTIRQSFGNRTSSRMRGFEGDLLNVLRKKLNFGVTIVEPKNGEQWGYALKQNSTGLMGMIQREEVDFGISCLGISVARAKVLKAGIAHYTTALVLAVPRGRRYTSFEKLFLPLKTKVWFFIAVFFLGAIVAISLVEYRYDYVRNFVYGRSVRSPYLNLLQVFFGVAMILTPTRNFARTLLFMWMIYSLVVRTCYQAALYHFLQKKSTLPPSQTLAEIDQTGALYYVVESGERYYEAFPHRLRSVRHLPQEHNNIIRRLEWMMRHPRDKDVVQGALDHIAYHNHLYRRRGGFQQICPEFIATFTVAIYYPKKSILTPQFDEQIRHIQASGLMSFWVIRYGDYDFFGRPRRRPRPKQLNNNYLFFAYELGGILLTASGVVFGLELASKKVRILRLLLDRTPINRS